VLGALDALRVIALDEWATLPLAEIGAEFLFSGHRRKSRTRTWIRDHHLPFSEWTQVVSEPEALLRRCWTGSRIAPTSSRRARTRIGFPRTWKGGATKRKGPNRRQRRYCLRYDLNALSFGPRRFFRSGSTTLKCCQAENHSSTEGGPN